MNAGVLIEYIDIGYNMVMGRFGDWNMPACLEMQVILGQPMESGRVFQDEFEVEKYPTSTSSALPRRSPRFSNLAEHSPNEGTGILPAPF